MTDSSARPSRTSLLPAIDAEKFEALEQSFLEAKDPVKLARLTLSYAAQESSAPSAAARLRRGIQNLGQLADSQEQVSWLLHELVRLDPTDHDAFEAVRYYYESTEKDRELIRLLEDLFERSEEVPLVRARELRRSLCTLYRDHAADPAKAAQQLAILLDFEDAEGEWLDEAEQLLASRGLIMYLGAPLASAYRRLGKAPEELSVLTRELEVARGSRLTEVQSRLAALRHDFLDDVDGAMELLEPLVSRDPAHDEARQRYLSVCEAQERLPDAARRLARALKTVTDPEARARVGVDLARVLLKMDDKERAKQELLDALEASVRTPAALSAAQLLYESYSDLSPAETALCLTAIAARESDRGKREQAATRLLDTSSGDAPSLSDEQRKIAYLALLDSDRAPAMLDDLEKLAEASHDFGSLGRVYDRRAELAQDPEQAAQFAYRAAELYDQHDDDPAARLARWQRYAQRFPNQAAGVEQVANLLEQAGRLSELLDLLRQSAQQLPAREAAAFLARAGELELTRFSQPAEALRSFERALELNPTQPVAIAALEDMMARGSKRLEAATLLESVARRASNDALLVDVLATKSALVSDSEARKAADIEVFELLRDKLDDPQRALALAARVLKDATSRDLGALVPWLERIRTVQVPEELLSLRARVLSSVLGEREIDSPETFALARDAGLALTQAGSFEAASAVYEKALMYDPSAADLALGLDALRARQGVTGAQRVAYLELALVDVEENLHSWCRVMGAIANIHRNDMGDPQRAAEAFKEVIERVPEDREAHRALVEIYQDMSDNEALAAELERAISVFSGADRLHAEFSLAMLRADAGEANRSLELCNKLLDTGNLTPEQLDSIADLAEQQGDAQLFRRVQERRIQDATDPLNRAQELERLGVLLSEQLDDKDAAAEAFKRAAQESLQVAGEEEYAKTLFERVLDVKPEDRETAEQFVRFCIDAGDWDRIVNGISVLIAIDAERAGSFVLELAGRAKADKVASRFVSVADDVLDAVADDQRLRHQLLGAKARVLANEREQRLEASQAFRAVVDAFGSREDEAEFERFIRGCPLDDDRTDDQRWLFARRAESADDPVSVLLEWARVEEEEFADPEAAIGVYDRLIEQHPGERRALERAARLKLQCGAHEGALEVLRLLKAASPDEQKPGVQLRIASLLIGDLGRADEGYDELTQLLTEQPHNLLAIELAFEGLQTPGKRALAAAALSGVLERSQHSEVLLERMLEALSGSNDLASGRKRWFEQLIALKSGESALAWSCKAASELPDQLDLWDRAEKLAGSLEQPEPVARAYEQALARQLPQELVATVGRRMLEFHEQWFGDSAVLLPALLNLLKQTPHARWALDRAVLALNTQARFDEAFGLFDAAITYAPEEERATLLDEAALTAKDLASDPERAIQYLEQLVELRPEDARAQSTLERLYKRCGQTRKLIDLLSKRLADLKGPDLIAMLDQIACRWLELDHSDEALECVRQILDLEPENERACQILERVLGTEDFAGADAWGGPSGSHELAETRERAAELLKATYQRMGRSADVVRIAEGELEFLDDARRRGEVLREIVAAKLGDLNDKPGAFGSLSKLVMLEPSADEPRAQLRQLADELERPRAYAELLVRAAENSAVECDLFLEAAQVYSEHLDDAQRETELYERVLQLAADDGTVLVAARALDRLLSGTEDVDHHCEVLERLAGVEREEAPRRDALVRAARLASGALGDWERSAKNWRDVLGFAANDREALDGLIEVLLAAGQRQAALPVLEVRASLLGGDAARADHVAIARTLADVMGDNAQSIERWLLIRERFGSDEESFDALAELLQAEQRWEAYADLLSTESAHAEGERRALLQVRLAMVRRDHLRDYSGALEAFVSAREWRDAVSIIEAADSKERAAELTDSLRVIAIDRWHAGDELAEDAAYWAIKSRAQQLLDQADQQPSGTARGRRKGSSPAERAFALLTESTELPFTPGRRRSLQRSAALVSADALHDAERALEIFANMFAEDVTDAAASKSVAKYSELLEQSGRHVDRAQLWERIARALSRIGDEQGARSYWEHAGQLWEQLEEPPLAIAAHQHAADLGSIESLEALTRLYLDQGDKHQALEALERIFELSSARELEACALRVLELSLELGERHKARSRLESAVAKLPDALELRARLAELYRTERIDEPLGKLLVAEAALVAEPAERVKLLTEAATVYRERLSNPAAALPLLEEALAIEPDNRGLALLLAEVESDAGLHDRAFTALNAQIESYGARRPKTRARVHRKLARALKAAGKPAEALQQLALAAEINSTDAGLLFEYASEALAAGDLDKAEQTFRASLLVLHRPAGDEVRVVSRADVYLSLSEVAAEKGERLATKDFIESAFETALEGRDEALQLEAALKRRGKDELLKRALETQLSRASSQDDKLKALAELTGVYARLDEKEARLESVASAAERLHKALDAASPGCWQALARVYAWLGNGPAEIDALERYLNSLPVSELRVSHAQACYRVAAARIGEGHSPDKALAMLRRAVALDPAPERRDALLKEALEAYPADVGFARAFVEAARSSGRENQLAEALAHLAELPQATLEEGRRAVRQCVAVGNASLMERATSALLARSDLDAETRYYLQTQLAQHYEATDRLAEAFDLKLALADEVEAPERARLLREAASLCERGLDDDQRRARVYRKLLNDEPADRTVWEPLFAAYMRLGDHAELKRIIEQTLPKVRGADRGALRLAQARLLLTEESEVDAAVSTLEKALDEDPSQREAAELLAETLERLGRLDELVGVFEGQLAAARANNDKQAFEALTLRVGALLERAERPADAVRAYQELLLDKPKHREALRALVELSDHTDVPEIVPLLRRLLGMEEGPVAASVALRLFERVSTEGDIPLCIEILEEGFKKWPGDELLRRHLVDAYTQTLDLQSAAGVLARAFEAQPGDARLLEEAVDAWVSAGQPERALSLLERRLEARPGDETLHFRRAQVLSAMGRDDEALVSLQRAHDEGGSYTDELIRALESLSQKKGRPESDLLILRLADLLESRGDDEAAREHLRELLRDSPDNSEALSRLAVLAEKHQDTADAIQAYRGLMRLEKGDDLVPIVFKLIDACEKLERLNEVLDDLERAREKLPDHERLRDRIRAVYEKSGETNRLAEVLIDDAARRDKPVAKAALLAQAARLVIDTDPTRAQALLEQAEQAHSSLESGVLLARLRAMRGQREDAIAELTRLAEPHESRKPLARVAALWELAQLYLRDDEILEAYDVLSQAHTLERRNGEVALMLGMLAVDLDDEKMAGRALRAVTAMKARTSTSQGARPDEKSRAYYLLGSIAHRKGDSNAARRMVQRAVSEDPDNTDAQSLLEVLQ